VHDEPARTPEDGDVLEFGPAGPGPRRPPRLRWVALGAAAVTVVVLAAHVDRGRPQASATPSSTSSTVDTAPPAGSPESAASPTVTEMGAPWLGITGSWELFGRGPTDVIRIEPASGRVTRTPTPALASNGPVSFLVGPRWAMIRPLDEGPGYLLPDGRAARELTGALAAGGPALPGPDGRSVWVQAPDGAAGMILVGVDGRAVGPSIPVPASLRWSLLPDGTGHLLVSGTGGVYEARPDGLRRVTTGALLAVGQTRVLVVECDDRHRCASSVIDRGTGARRVLDPSAPDPSQPAGVISPDGSTAAMLAEDPSGAGAGRPYLLDLADGTRRTVQVRVDQPFDGALVWAPNARWLFVVGSGGKLYAVEAATGRARGMPVTLPPVTELAVRPAG
jgi:hypothetical protein